MSYNKEKYLPFVFVLFLKKITTAVFRLKVPAGSSVELSSDGYDFLTFVFDKYDQDKDKALSPQELVNLFSTCPVMPWGPDVYNTVLVCDKGWLNLQVSKKLLKVPLYV